MKPLLRKGTRPRPFFIAAGCLPGSCFGAGISGLRFAVLGAIMYTLKERFLLTNEQVGSISGAGLWGSRRRCWSAVRCATRWG